jgi:hypothetical protein
MFGSNVYIITSPSLIYSLHKQPRQLSFWYFEAMFTAKLGGFSRAGTEASFKGILPEVADKERSPVIDVLKTTVVAMSPQGDMGRLLGVAAERMGRGLDEVAREGRGMGTEIRKGEGAGGEETVDLCEWVQHEMVMATTEAFYGSKNPYRDGGVEEGFWYVVFALAVLLLLLLLLLLQRFLQNFPSHLPPSHLHTMSEPCMPVIAVPGRTVKLTPIVYPGPSCTQPCSSPYHLY